MFRVAILVLFLALYQANAFVAPRVSSSRSSMSMLVGSSAPLGFFDPFGLSKGASAATIDKYRESELKHGRVAMLAVFGVLTQEKFHPLYNGKLSGNPLEALSGTPFLGLLQIFFFCGIIEYAQVEAAKNKDYTSGDVYGFNLLTKDTSDSNWVSFQTRELNNGRLAMFAILGELAHASITGKGPLAYWGI